MENNSQRKKIFTEWDDEFSILNNPPKPPSEQFKFSGEFGKTIPYKELHCSDFSYNDDVLFFDINTEKEISNLLLEKENFLIYLYWNNLLFDFNNNFYICLDIPQDSEIKQLTLKKLPITLAILNNNNIIKGIQHNVLIL